MFGFLRGLNLNKSRTLYPPNSRMSVFKRRILIFVHNFIPTDDVSITPECFFTLGKWGKPNQSSWSTPFCVLGKCMHRYNPGQFIDIDAAVRSTVQQIILTNHIMFFGGIKNWCHKRTGNLTSYNDLAQLTNPIGEIFHEKLCAKITEDGGDYRVIFLGEHEWEGCRDWFYDDKILNLRSIARGSFIQIIFTMTGNKIASCAHWMLVLHFFPENRRCKLMTLRKAHYSTLGASRSPRRKLMISRRKQSIYGWKRSN